MPFSYSSSLAIIRFAGVISLGATLLSQSAKAQLLNTPNIQQLCRAAPVITHRKTVVYVDIAAIRNSKTEWGLTILNRLELAPREGLTLVAANLSTFEIKEVF